MDRGIATGAMSTSAAESCERRPSGRRDDRACGSAPSQPSHELAEPGRVHIRRLKSRAQFLAAAKGASLGRGAVVVQRLDRADGSARIGEGFTATRKIGNAVTRNRAKRRLREAARLLLPRHGEAGCDYVFIARAGAGERPWTRLLDDVGSALIGLAEGRDEPRPTRAPRRPPPPPSRENASGPRRSDG